jgi:uncharacterized phage protein (TIGR02218 family)
MGSLLWTMTAGPDVEYNSEIYEETPIKRNGIEQKNEISKATLEVSIPIDHPIALNLLTTYTEEVMTITIFTKIDAVYETSWKGRLASIKPADESLTLNFESVFTSLRRPGLRARFQRSCRHALYGRGCGLDFADHAVPATITSITGTTLVVPEAALQASGYYTGGMIAAADGALSYIISHTGSSLVLQRVSYSILSEFAITGSGTPVNLYPGCDHARSTCIGKFNNLLNYGGFDWIPNKNPMGGSSII